MVAICSILETCSVQRDNESQLIKGLNSTSKGSKINGLYHYPTLMKPFGDSKCTASIVAHKQM